MSIKIHHGPPGSYKSSGAIYADVLPAIKAGRYIITNVRGFNVARCREVLGDAVPDSFSVLYIETESQEGRDRLARFYHWAPKGAFFLVDEVQRIFPPAWRQSDLDNLAYPGGPDVAKQDGRPETIEVAFDMHRHHNWDFCFTTPNIKKVHAVIRAAAETAIRHTNLGLLGLKGRYKTVLHLADNSGSSFNDVLQAKPFNKVPGYVFKLYDSTTTGKVSDTIAGSSLLRDPKILFLLAFISLCIYGGFFHDWGGAITGKNGATTSAGSKAGVSNNPQASAVLHTGGAVVSPTTGAVLLGPFAGLKLYISCSVAITGTNNGFQFRYCFSAKRDNQAFNVNMSDWPDVFTKIEAKSPCHAVLTYIGKPLDVYCDPQNMASTGPNSGAVVR